LFNQRHNIEDQHLEGAQLDGVRLAGGQDRFGSVLVCALRS